MGWHISTGLKMFGLTIKKLLKEFAIRVTKNIYNLTLMQFTLRFNTRKFATQKRFDLVLSAVTIKRLTYQDLTK